MKGMPVPMQFVSPAKRAVETWQATWGTPPAGAVGHSGPMVLEVSDRLVLVFFCLTAQELADSSRVSVRSCTSTCATRAGPSRSSKPIMPVLSARLKWPSWIHGGSPARTVGMNGRIPNHLPSRCSESLEAERLRRRCTAAPRQR